MGRDTTAVDDLFAQARSANRGALARLLSVVERGGDQARVVSRLASACCADTYTVGITGAPGAGKSTLTSALIGHARSRDLQLAVLAIDPSSPFTGGAILGDRVRMQEHATDPGVFIRSMATRGHLGGLSLATPEAIRLLAATGYSWVLVETVGVGQVELEIAARADTTVVVVNPGWGDAVQAAKAGLMEIADIFVVNKSDRAGAHQTRHDLESMLDLGSLAPSRGPAWRPLVISTVATTGDGAAELWAAIGAHRTFITEHDVLHARRQARLADELRDIVTYRLQARARAMVGSERWVAVEADVAAGRVDPWTAADQLLGPVGA